MPRIIWVAIAITIAISVLLIGKSGFEPKPISLFSPSYFSNQEQLGEAVFKRLYPRFRESPNWILGQTEMIGEARGIWGGLISGTRRAGLALSVVGRREGLEPIGGAGGGELLVKKSGEIAEQLRQSSDQYRLWLVGHDWSSHFYPGTPLFQWRQVSSAPVLSLTIVPLAIQREQIPQLNPRCPEGAIQPNSWEKLACEMARVSRKASKLKPDPRPILAALEQHGPLDFVLYYHRKP